MEVLERVQMVDGGITYKSYIKVKDIGSGSFAKCWLVRTPGSTHTHALKIITKKQMKILENERLVEEVKVHQSLVHPHVVYLDHCFEDEDYKYILLEYCQKGTLDSSNGVAIMEEDDIRRYGKQMIEALKYLHSQGILHRDLKLGNFFIDANDNIKLGDFGFACKLQYPGQLRRETCGTPNYIAPEVIGGFGYSFPSDVWSIGAILYKLRFGQSPFESFSLKETLQNVKLANYSFPKKTKISSELQDLISKILVVNYDDRYTLEEIGNHPFFTDKVSEVSELKRQSSIGKLFSKLWSRSKSKDKKDTQLHKIVSCENLREMKTILREKMVPSEEVSYFTEDRSQKKIVLGCPPIPNSPKFKQNKLSQKPKSLMVSHFYPGVIAVQVIQQKHYTIAYLSNGLRQIIHLKDTCVVSPDGQYFNKDGKKVEPSKIMGYIVKTYMQESPIQCPNLKGELTSKKFITEWRTVNDYLALTIGMAEMFSLSSQKLVYLHLKETSYLYNRSLEIVSNELLLAKMDKMMIQTVELARVKSLGTRKFIL